MSRAESLEVDIHGRARQYSDDDLAEAHFGVHDKIVLARGIGVPGAQWTGVATAIATTWLESGAVDAVVVAGFSDDSSGAFGAPAPVLCRSAKEVLQGRRVKPSLCPSLAVLDEVAADRDITRLLFCGVGCAVQALRAMNGADPESALGLEVGGLHVLGTHCVDNSPTPDAARTFVSAIPGIGPERANDVLACIHGGLEPRPSSLSTMLLCDVHRCSASPPIETRSVIDEFMADFRVHARLREKSTTAPAAESVVKQAYMTLPPSVGVPSIAPSCFSCFDYTNGLADVVVGYMGAPFDADVDEMTSAALMVTVRNGRGHAMLDEAVRAGCVEILQDGGHGGRGLPSSGDRTAITMKTVAADSMVKTLLDPLGFVAADKGAPPFIANVLAKLIARALPTGLEFGRFSIDYHYLRNQLYVDDRMGRRRAARHVPAYARAIMRPYDAAMGELRAAAAATEEGGGGGGGGQRGGEGGAGATAAAAADLQGWAALMQEALLLM